MAIYRPPPPPFIGGAGPLLPRRLPPSELAVPVNDPPASSGLRNVALLAIVVGMWQPSLLGLPQGRARFGVQPGPVVADDPSFTSRTALPTIVATWEPPPPAPQAPKKIPAALLAVAEDDPPFTSRDTRPTILTAWEPLPPAPQVAKKIPPSVLAVPADDPAFTSRTSLPTILDAWQPPPPLPWPGWNVNPALEAVPADDPPFTARTNLPTIREAWEPPPPRPWFGWNVHPSIEAVAVNDPPIGRRLWLSTVLETWRPDPPQPQASKLLVPQEVAVDDPPFGQRLWLSVTLRSWEPGPPQPWPGWKVHPSIEAVPEDDPPFTARVTLPTILEAWQPDVRARIPRRFVPQGVLDDPPFGQRLWMPVVLRAWEPPAPLPWQGWKVHPSIEAVAVNDPPIGRRLWLSTILEGWHPAAFPHVRRVSVPQVVVVVGDDPPFRQRRQITTIETILGVWRPPVQPFTRPPGVISPRNVHRIPVMHCFPWQLQVLAQQTTPPGAPAKGERYVVTSVATGIWAGHEDAIAWYDGASWQFDVPTEGWATYDLGVSTMLFFDGAAWITWTIP